MFLSQRNDKYVKKMNIQISTKSVHEASLQILYAHAITCRWKKNENEKIFFRVAFSLINRRLALKEKNQFLLRLAFR